MTADQQTTNRELATLGGGCFWCLEAVYLQMRGVHSVASGYMGGQTAEPTYEAVCAGRTGHAEVVRLAYDPQVVSFRELLEVFFVIHDPTTLNQQGADVGTQYRSAVFYHSAAQRSDAQAMIAELTQNKVFADPIVTEITPATTFYPAESYHQNYFAQNPGQPYCQYVVAPKIAKFRHKFLEKMKSARMQRDA